jgi:hypothetical protein
MNYRNIDSAVFSLKEPFEGPLRIGNSSRDRQALLEWPESDIAAR